MSNFQWLGPSKISELPILAVWAGIFYSPYIHILHDAQTRLSSYNSLISNYKFNRFSLDKTSIAEGQLETYIQQAIEQINFVIGDPVTNEQEIGNEDFIGSSIYTYRWKDFATTLKMEFPDLHMSKAPTYELHEFIATTQPFNPILLPNPTEYDVHVYRTPTWFHQNSFIYDGFQQNRTKYFEVPIQTTKISLTSIVANTG
ncbi:hypothetical protein BDQ12DRAFT_668021 [Crucibulum laeve]|uniref:Alpha-L-arabinofuranosidase 1 catalytic domain-containing protein n=1 Tax=Crucibulum laeve TaxID=68775 RepID=A0A5C3LVY8_9AGAR|nr:hypothetical protein BDQ12DRAFT_668021 [Crucibulum laeve]